MEGGGAHRPRKGKGRLLGRGRVLGENEVVNQGRSRRGKEISFSIRKKGWAFDPKNEKKYRKRLREFEVAIKDSKKHP